MYSHTAHRPVQSSHVLFSIFILYLIWCYTYSMNCKLCNFALLEIVYGFPTQEMIEKSKRDEIVLGGLPRPFGPTHYCLECQEEFGQGGDTRTPTFSHSG